jgi:hypothetical protein
MSIVGVGFCCVWLVVPCGAAAQSLHFNGGRQGVSFGGDGEASLVVAGRTVTVNDHQVLNRDESSDTVVTFSLTDVVLESLEDTGWPDGSQFVRFACKPGRKCFHIAYRCSCNGDGRRPPSESICGATANVLDQRDDDQDALSLGFGAKFPCRPSECGSFVSAVKALMSVAPTAAVPTPAPRIDCNALLSTYYRPGEVPVIPPECQRDPLSTYRPGAGNGISAPMPARSPEPVIDGPKIPSRIDFTSPLTPARPAPSVTPSAPPTSTPVTRTSIVPAPIVPAPIALTPAPRPTSRPEFTATDRANNDIARLIDDSQSLEQDLRDIEQDWHPANVLLKGPFQYPKDLIERVMKKIESVFTEPLGP